MRRRQLLQGRPVNFTLKQVLRRAGISFTAR
jgi:hypothetical protein